MNLVMHSKVESGEAVDLKDCPRTPEGYYVLDKFEPDMDYCDTSTECWIWSVGISRSGDQLLAATDSSFYGNTEFRCLFLR